MEPVYFVMAILGCGDDGMQCSQQRIEPVRYVNAAECQAAMPAALIRNTDIDFPVVGAACQPRGRQVAGADAPRAPSNGG